MSTTMANCRIALSKDLQDYHAGTTTSIGNAGGTTYTDLLLRAKPNNWVGLNAFDLLTSGTYADEERKISALDNSSGTLTVLAHGGQVASSTGYEVHRLWSASDKRLALIQGAKDGYPAIHNKVVATGKTVASGAIDITALTTIDFTKAIELSWEINTAASLWEPIDRFTVDTSANKIYLDEFPGYTSGWTVRIEGMGYLQFLKTGAESTAWDSTIAINDPQLRILTAAAAIYLYQGMVLPNFSSGTNETFAKALAYWHGELERRIRKFKLPRIAARSAY